MKALAWTKRAVTPVAAVFDNPILLKELRAGMRGARYFIAFMTVLTLVSAVILITFALTGAARGQDPAEIGSGVFIFAFSLNIIVAFLVVPSFGATSITSERERQTYDILMSTTLTARQIVWGKLLGSLAQVGAMFLSTIPIVGLTFLFGGVTVRQMVAGYMTLFAICILLSSWAISISASSNTSQRAVASAYGGAILVFFVFWALAAVVSSSSLAFAFAETYGVSVSPRYHMWGGIPTIDPWVRVLYVYMLPAFGFFSFVWLLLLNAATRLKSPFDEKSPPFRIYYLAVAGGGLALAYAIFITDIAAGSVEERMTFFMIMACLSFIVTSLSCIFAAETPVPATHVRRRYVDLKGFKRWRWILSPGSRTGVWFCLGTNMFFAAVAIALFAPHTHGFDRGSWLYYPAVVPLLRAFLVVACWIVFLSGAAAWIVTVLPGRPRTVGAIIALSVLALSAIPMVHWSVTSTVTEQNIYSGEVRSDFPGPVTLLLSPIAGIWTSLTTHHDGIHHLPLEVSFLGSNLPLHGGQAALFLILGTMLHVFAGRRRKRMLERMS